MHARDENVKSFGEKEIERGVDDEVLGYEAEDSCWYLQWWALVVCVAPQLETTSDYMPPV
jgi:hypothetical protein